MIETSPKGRAEKKVGFDFRKITKELPLGVDLFKNSRGDLSLW